MDAEAHAATHGAPGLSLASRAVHADDGIAVHRAVAPALHVSTTFRYDPDPERLQPGSNLDSVAPRDSHAYSRDSTPNTSRLEALLTSILGGPSVTYASGLAAFHAMLVRINRRRIAIEDGYHRCHRVIALMRRFTGLQVLTLDCDASELQPGDIVHVETPLNPTGEARNLQEYAKKASFVGAYLTVDATFAPPPLQDPFALGADVVMHSGTKYLGGHSDMLCSVLAIRPGLEGWLGIRSLRTLDLRIRRQSATASDLVAWLACQIKDTGSAAARLINRVQHASLQAEARQAESWLRRQMPGGYGPVFALRMKDEAIARCFPSRLRLFQHATSLGGVESLIEWRAMSDDKVDRTVLRLSIGVEALEDLQADLEAALQSFL